MLPVKSALPSTVSRFFDDDWVSLFDWSNRNLVTEGTLPSVNVKETPDTFVLEMAAPGMKKDDFKIELNNNILTIKNELHQENETKEGESYTRKEFSYQAFQRSFNLNNKVVDDANIKATYVDGILHLTLPKKEEAKDKPVRLIQVK